MNTLLEIYSPSKLPDFIDFFTQRKSQVNISLKGLAGSSLALTIAKLEKQFVDHQLFILPDRESAAFLYHDLELLLDDKSKDLTDKRVHYFPSSFRRAYKYEELDNANVKLRSEIINKLLHKDDKYLIVTYPEAIAEKLISYQYLKSNSFTIKKDELLPIDILLEFLYEYQYVQEEFVFEPGQFAWRGGIFDLYSYSEEHPFRIELSGDHVESIRQFDPDTQLSVREADELTIMPMVNHAEMREERVSFFEFLKGKPDYWLMKIDDLTKQIETNFEKVTQEYESQTTLINLMEPSELYITREDFLRAITKNSIIEINTEVIGDYGFGVDFNIMPQTALSKNFEMLLDEWIENYLHGYQTVFLSDNDQQIKRMQKIMNDLLVTYNQKHETNYIGDELYVYQSMVLHEGFRDEEGKLCVYTDHQFFGKYHRFSIRDRYRKSEQFTLKEIYDLQPGDYVVHIDHGVGIYRGLEKLEVDGKEQEAIKLEYKSGDILYISIHSLHKISKYVGKEGSPPTLHRIGSGSWDKLKEKTKKRVKEIAIDLIKLYAKRKAQKGMAFSPDTYLQTELEASFIYEDTPDQVKSLSEVKSDMESEHPMDRLICGDVGFGKTEVAIRAAFKAVADSKQVAVLVPTTVLALQHYNTFSERLGMMPCKVDYVNRFKSSKQIKETLQKVKEGQIDILIGTHRLLSKDVEFKDLGLLIIDEEQKFGVAAKEKLREFRETIDTLTLSATPIPRTLQFSLMGARDISVISMPPPNRHPIQTEVHAFSEELIRDAVSYEIGRGGQVFIVHNKVQNIYELAGLVQRLVPEARVAVGHGQMEGDKLEKIMSDFISGEYDVLVATTIIESGLDITNANTMIINDAQNFALNVLHQLRGRVGRNNKKAFCYLMIPSHLTLNDQARKRLKAIEDYSDLGSGFQIAMRDLDIRGAGDILGADQSGFISEIGFEMYQKILNEAIQELKEKDFETFEMADNSAIMQRECLLETDLGAMLPTEYVSSVSERMSLYKELDSLKTDAELEKFAAKLRDMFGALPKETKELLQTIPLRREASKFYFERIVLKKGKFSGYFIGDSTSPFYQSELFNNILLFMQKHHPAVQMKEVNKKLVLTIQNVTSIEQAMKWMERMVVR
ncbi:transcription-repair coupling factor [Bacteroidales bacterium OttesenSCG-928-E04]|nr:transcription-repair coupling factor [Bacteroidales bacterium OttesenSCG-928-E04]